MTFHWNQEARSTLLLRGWGLESKNPSSGRGVSGKVEVEQEGVCLLKQCPTLSFSPPHGEGCTLYCGILEN